jgi:hypothetical protein
MDALIKGVVTPVLQVVSAIPRHPSTLTQVGLEDHTAVKPFKTALEMP